MQKLRSSKFKAFSLVEMSIVILIIGVLISGVISGSRMYNSARLATARSLTASSPVTGMKDLYLWLDATAEKSFLPAEASDGKRISVWNDINPQNMQSLSLRQTKPAIKPFYHSSSYKGLPSIDFKRVGNSATSLISSDKYDVPQEFTIFAVTQVDGTPSNFVILDTGSILFRYHPYPSIFVYDNGGKFEPRAETSQSAFGIPTLLVVSFDGLELTITRNQSPPTTKGRNVTLARRGNNPQIASSSIPNNRIFEIILIYKKLNTEETAAVTKYLNQKWQIF